MKFVDIDATASEKIARSHEDIIGVKKKRSVSIFIPICE
jgi:hypothetical protein